MEPWIKLYRKFTEWEWYQDVNCKVVFLHLLLTANWKAKRWQGKVIDVGELVTSYPMLAESVSLSEQQIRTALSKLESSGVITRQSTHRYTIIKVLNYCTYQSSTVNEQQSEQQTDNTQITDEQQTDNRPITAPKELKNNRNIDIYINNNKGAEFRQVIEAYEQNIGIISPIVLDALKDLISSHDAALVKLALEEACKSNARNIRYIESIIQAWDKDGVKTVESAKLKMAEHRQRQSHKKDKPPKSKFANYPKGYNLSDNEKEKLEKMMEEYEEV